MTKEIGAIRALPSLRDVAVNLLGHGHIRSEEGDLTTFRLPDGMALEIDCKERAYRREIVGSPAQVTIDLVAGTETLNLVKDVTGWDMVHCLGWVERHYGSKLMASCLAEWTRSTTGPLPAGAETSLGASLILAPQLEKRSKLGWATLRKVLVDDYRFNPDLIDALNKEGTLGANSFGDLLLFSTNPDKASRVEVHSLMKGVIAVNDNVPTNAPFTLGSGSRHLVVIDGPLQALALWQSIPAEIRPSVSLATIGRNHEPSIWGELRGKFPDARLCNAFGDAHREQSPANLQTVFDAPIPLSPTPFKSWVGAWYRQSDGKVAAVQFQKMQVQLVAAISPGMTMDV